MDKAHCKLTREGYERIKLQQIRSRKRREALDERMSDISLSENTSENLEYQEMRRQSVSLTDEINRLTNILENAEIMEERSYSKVQEGCKIRLENHKICYMLQIVHSLEANSIQGKVSCSSPLGNSLLGKRVGDEVMVVTPLGEIKFDVISIV